MTAQPVFDEPGPDDPAQILRTLPPEYHAQFRAEYTEAVEAARQPEEYAALTSLVRLWRLRAAAYSDPGFADRRAAARDRSGDISLEQVLAEHAER